jgi:zinc protease
VMSVLGRILSNGKNSRFYKSMVYDKQIAQSVFGSQGGSEIAGTFQIQVTAKPGHDLTEMERSVDTILGEVLTSGVTQTEIDDAIAGIESQVVQRLGTILGKANALASYYSYTGDPENINKQMDFFKNITPAEVLSTAKQYLTKPNVVLSIVPNGKPELAAKKGE